ncbi:MAG: GAF domain-containing protein [Firmicutes bacterium]|nr:GAF domain-containing protein [Bacillota bacterium]
MSALYDLLTRQVQSLLIGNHRWVTDLANVAACLYHGLPSLNWIGFYLLSGDELWLGPFQGKPACTVIPVGKGVCGTAVQKREAICVLDVHDFPGHIACDPASRSELVVPLLKGGEVLGVIDADSPLVGRFGPEDVEGMRRIADILVQRVAWE